MNNLTKMKINRPASEVFEAFVDPAKIGSFWFSSSSERWEAGKMVTLRYDEYYAEVVVKITDIETNRKIVFEDEEGHTTTITLKEENPSTTIIVVNEDGFDEKDVEGLIDNKEGWVYMLTCLKAYIECGISTLRAALVK